MPLFSFMKRLFRPSRPRQFSLGKRGLPGIPGGREDVVRGKHLERRPYTNPATEQTTLHGVWKPVKKTERAEVAIPSDQDPAYMSPFGGMPPGERELLGSDLVHSLDENLKALRSVFHAPRNSDFIVKPIKIKKRIGGVKAAVMYMSGLVDYDAVRQGIVDPLLRATALGKGLNVDITSLAESVITGIQVKKATKYAHVTSAMVEGETVLLVDGENVALACGTRSPEHRPISESPTEAVIRGPHTGFVENLSANVTMVRVNLSSPSLVSERHYLGARSHTPFVILYLEGVVNPKLVEEVRRRMISVRAATVTGTEVLVASIQDSPRDPFPTYLITERPDMCASMIAEGHVVILGNSPSAIILPATVWALMHSSEDYYVNYMAASAIRLLRWLALFTTMYASALYVAIVTFHPSMIPTELLFAIASARESVPFPAVFEVLVMEVAFELIREAGIRIPTIVGPTIGIVGAVILGQAAVQASIVSPVLVVVVAVSGLGSFAIPNYNLSLYARLTKFVMISAAGILGLPGLTLASLCIGTHILSLRSLGVPLTAPLLPHWDHSADLVLRGPIGSMKARPQSTRPLDAKRRASGSTAEVPTSPPAPRGNSGDEE